ncbi:MAG TPA: protein kinase [Polyangiaceae bacterium]|nr:protein kinase [Polyangiaceae bacterium]
MIGGVEEAPSTLGGRFVVEREVGRGGVGIVYRALDRITGHTVALKVIAIAGVDASEEARFAREGRLLAGLSAPGIVKVIAFGQLDEGQPYVAMEWLQGEDIAQRQLRQRVTITEALDVAAQVADALACAHAAGIVHRDVKPSNVILVGSGAGEPGAEPAPLVAKLVDFGVASAEDARITRTGAIVGTPAYMAPEQARGDSAVDVRSDIYSLGATLFEMLTGRPPHVGPTPVAVLAKLVTTPAPRLRELFHDAPLSLDELLGRMLSTFPEERPDNASDVADELRRIRDAHASQGPETVRNPMSEPPGSVGGQFLTSSRGLGGQRLVTSILATFVPKGPARHRLLAHLRARGAEATELGGDAIVAHFGVHKTLGDEAWRALDLGARLAKTNSAVGVASGRSRIDRTKPTGEVVDRAAALARDARRGQVLSDTTTTELARGRFEFQLRPDGTSIVGDAVTAKRETVGGAPFLGREAELAQIVRSFEQCAEERTPILVSVTGTPGIGKTRLRSEALASLGALPSAPRVALVRCESFAKTHALGVMADVARALTGLPKTAGHEELMDALSALVPVRPAQLEGLGGSTRELVGRLLTNEAVPNSVEQSGARDALWIMLTMAALNVAARAPLVLAIEDAQWSDSESLAWLDHVLARAGRHPIFVLMTARPAFLRELAQRFTGREHVRLELRPLAKRTVRAIATTILGARAEGAGGEELLEMIAAQSSGSPLFAEELSRLAAQGRDPAGALTIEAALQVHLDALDEDLRDAVTRLAVFGLKGWDVGLAALGFPRAHEALRALAGAEILVEQAGSRFRDAREWAFKHALAREVAYASLGEDDLRELHARAGRWLAGMGEDDATVARHLELGGQAAEGAVYLERAARRALATNAHADAAIYAERALAFAEDKPTQFGRALLLDEAYVRLDPRAADRETAVALLEDAVYDEASAVRARGARLRYDAAKGGGPETITGLDEIRKSAQELGIFDEVARSSATLAARYAFAGELDRAALVASELLDLAARHRVPGASVDAWQTLAVVRQARGEVGAALEARRSAASAARAAGLKANEATLTINVGFALTTVGAKEEARAAIDAGIGLAQAVGSQGVLRHGQMILLCWASTFGATDDLEELLAEPRRVADGAASGGWVPHDRATLGVLYYRGVELLRSVVSPDVERARVLLRTAAGAYRSTKMLDLVPVALGEWAEAERRLGEPERAQELALEAAALLEDGSPSLLNEAPIFLALHDVYVDLGRLREARDAIVRAMPRLLLRVQGLRGTPYGREFLTNVAQNAGLVAAAEAYGLVPEELQRVLDGA